VLKKPTSFTRRLQCPLTSVATFFYPFQPASPLRLRGQGHPHMSAMLYDGLCGRGRGGSSTHVKGASQCGHEPAPCATFTSDLSLSTDSAGCTPGSVYLGVKNMPPLIQVSPFKTCLRDPRRKRGWLHRSWGGWHAVLRFPPDDGPLCQSRSRIR